MYVNGEYWGVYDLREKVDDNDFTEYYYNQPAEDIDVIQSYGGTWADYGSTQPWLNLCNFILNNDMSQTENLIYIRESIPC